MDKDPLLVLDMSNLAWRAYHTTGGLSHREIPTGVMYGIFDTMFRLMERFHTKRLMFAFDHGNPIRKKMCKSYKGERHDKEFTKEEVKAYECVRQQIMVMKTRYLVGVGFENVCFQEGYEADDIMANAAKTFGDEKGQQVVLVTSDRDLYQCLSPNVQVYDPRTDEVMTDRYFRNEYKIAPKSWAWVKAIAGKPKELKGVAGIGRITALKWLRKELPHTHKAFSTIRSNSKLTNNNYTVSVLPLEGCFAGCHYQDDRLNGKRWDKLMKELGIKTLPNPKTFVPSMPNQRFKIKAKPRMRNIRFEEVQSTGFFED